MFVIGGITRFIIGPDDRNFNDGERFILKARAFKEMTGLSEGIAIKSSQAITVFLGIYCCFNSFLVFESYSYR